MRRHGESARQLLGCVRQKPNVNQRRCGGGRKRLIRPRPVANSGAQGMVALDARTDKNQRVMSKNLPARLFFENKTQLKQQLSNLVQKMLLITNSSKRMGSSVGRAWTKRFAIQLACPCRCDARQHAVTAADRFLVKTCGELL